MHQLTLDLFRNCALSSGNSDKKLASTNLIQINLSDFHAESTKLMPEIEKCSVSSTESDTPIDCFIETKTRKKRNQMSFTMKRIDTQKLAQQEVPIEETDKNISSFACRADVIYKKILRDFRRYFINDFHQVIGSNPLKRTRAKPHFHRCFSDMLKTFSEQILNTRKR